MMSRATEPVVQVGQLMKFAAAKVAVLGDDGRSVVTVLPARARAVPRPSPGLAVRHWGRCLCRLRAPFFYCEGAGAHPRRGTARDDARRSIQWPPPLGRAPPSHTYIQVDEPKHIGVRQRELPLDNTSTCSQIPEPSIS